ELGLDHFQSGSLTRYDDLVRRNESREYCWHVRCSGGDSDEHFPLEDDQLHRHERCSDSAKFFTCPIANSSHAKRPAKSSFYRICATSKFHFSAALRSLT